MTQGDYFIWTCSVCGRQCDPDLHWGCEHVTRQAAPMTKVAVVPAGGTVDPIDREPERSWTALREIEAVLVEHGEAIGFPLADAVLKVCVERDQLRR